MSLTKAKYDRHDRLPAPARILFWLIFLHAVALGSTLPVMPALLGQLSSEATLIYGALGSGYAALQILFVPVLGRLSDRVGPRPVLLGAALASAVDYMICAITPSLIILVLARLLAGTFAANVAIWNACIASLAEGPQRTRLFGFRSAIFSLGLIVGPAVGGALSTVSLRHPFALAALLSIANPNLYRSRLDEALGLFTGSGDGGAALLAHVEAQMRDAAGDERFERAAWLRRRHTRLRVLLERLGPLLRAAHTHPRLVLAEGPEGADLFWLVGGRVVDWTAADPELDVVARTADALRGRAEPYVPADEIDELRIVSTWLAAHDPPVLDLSRAPSAGTLVAFAGVGRLEQLSPA